MNMRLVLVASLLIGSAANGHAQRPTTGDPEADLLCIQILNAKTPEEYEGIISAKMSALFRAHSEAEAELHQATAAEERAFKVFAATENARSKADVELSGLLTGRPTLNELVAEKDKARAELARIKELEHAYEEAKAALAPYATITPGSRQNKQELSRLQQEVSMREQVLRAVNKPEVEGRLQAVMAEHDRKRDRMVLLRAIIDVLEIDEKAAKRKYAAEQRKVEETKAEIATLRLRGTAAMRCVEAKRPEFGLAGRKGDSQLDQTLDTLDRSIGEAEGLAKSLAGRCAALDGSLNAMRTEAANIAAEADSLAARAGASPSASGQRLAAVADARTAAAMIARLRANTKQVSDGACRNSQAIVKNPGDPASRPALVEAQRLRSEAESNVGQLAVQLEAIRTAYATAQRGGTAAPAPASPADLAALKSRLAELDRKRVVFNSTVDEIAALQRKLDTVTAALQEARKGVPTERVAKLLARIEAIDRKCYYRAVTLNPDAVVARAATKIKSVETAPPGSAAQPAQPAVTGDPAAEIEALFNTARADAEGAATEATNAVRCEAAARNAMNNPAGNAPPPVSPPAAPPPTGGDMLLVWGGVWQDAFGATITIGNTTGGAFPISYRLHESWAGTCNLEAGQPRVAHCQGQGGLKMGSSGNRVGVLSNFRAPEACM